MHRLYDGRVYIGITSKKPEQRWLNGRGYEKSKKFYNAILKYGWNSFEHIILESGLTKDQAEKREVELIAEYDSTNRFKGFNVALGGSCCVPLSEEVKEQLREKATGRKASEDTKLKMSKTRKGRKQSDEHIKHRAATRIGTHLSEEKKKKRKIMQLNSAGEIIREFDSLSEAAKACNTTSQNIWMSANARRAKAGGYMWRYAEEVI